MLDPVEAAEQFFRRYAESAEPKSRGFAGCPFFHCECLREGCHAFERIPEQGSDEIRQFHINEPLDNPWLNPMGGKYCHALKRYLTIDAT